MALTSSSPSVSRTPKSSIARSYGASIAAASLRCCNAVWPLRAQSALTFHAASCRSRIRRWVALPSTIKTRRFSRLRVVQRTGAGLRAFCSLTVNQNVEPSRGTLSTPISPPMSSTSCLLIASPRPVPPYRRVVEPSSWEKQSKIIDWLERLIPTPLSSTSNLISSDADDSLKTENRATTSPLSVNFTALPMRFTRTWRSRNGSPRTLGT